MLYKRIQELCKGKNISVYRLEKKLEFSSGAIRKWSNSMPAADKLQKVANELGCTIDDLLEESR